MIGSRSRLLIAVDAGTAITAAIYIETVFGLRGFGNLAVQALSGQSGGFDLPLTVGLVTTVGVFVVALNLAADLAAPGSIGAYASNPRPSTQ